ncbi:fibronectin type III domain-containing protein (plasmid) [Pontibacillus sp. ALD_SL1]|nr:fibronectin type III domain-containing protein [Pontibacillus sp. ALD_SL1]QST02264.1 fibronectin type III domain-containing protein [Pontibacillus sp. ALD_SL1]
MTKKTNNSISLSWDVSEKAKSYKLKRGNTVIYEGPLTSFTATGLESASFYRFYVYSVNDYGPSRSSSYVESYTSGESLLPDEPRNFRITSTTDTSQTLTWDKTEKASTYLLKRANNVIYEGPLTSFTEKNLTPGTRYAYYLYPVNKEGRGDYAYEVGYTTGTNPYPQKPYLKIKNVSHDRLTLYWQPTENTTSYTVRLNGDYIYNGSGTSFTVTNLEPATYYYFYLRANNQNGSSGWDYESQKTKANAYNDTTYIDHSCKPLNYENTFHLPIHLKPGSSGRFELTVKNNFSSPITAKLNTLTTSGDLFEGDTPLELTYSDEAATIEADKKEKFIYAWKLPQDAPSSYADASGSFSINVGTTCSK